MTENKKNNKKGKSNTNKSVKLVNEKKKVDQEEVKAKKNLTDKEIKNEKVLDKKDSKAKEEKNSNLKQARKQLYYNNNSESSELSKLIKIVLIVTVIMIIFYGVTAFVTEKAKEATEEQNKQEVEIQYDSIVIGSMLNINGTFYVLIEDEDDVRLNEYTTLIQTISASEDAPKIYTADLSSSFNEHYFSDKTNYDSDMSKFRVKGTTLVRVSDHEITDVYDNHDSIVDELNNLDEVK